MPRVTLVRCCVLHRTPLVPLSRGAGSFAAVGLKKTIRYQLSALRCGQRSPVGNGFIRSVCHGFVGTSQSGNRKNCIGTSVKALLKKCRRHTAIIHYSLFIIHWGGHRPSLLPSPQAPQGEDNGVRCKIQQRTCVTRGSHGFARALEPGSRNHRIRSSPNAPPKISVYRIFLFCSCLCHKECVL